jgi:hypothetical protein
MIRVICCYIRATKEDVDGYGEVSMSQKEEDTEDGYGDDDELPTPPSGRVDEK